MSKTTTLLSIAAGLLLFTSCAVVTTSPLTGFLYSDLTAPHSVTESDVGTKMGTATAQSVLGLVATGDASVAAACRDGGITKIHHVDFYAKSILGIIATYEVRVYGS